MDTGSTQVIGIFRSEPAADAADGALAAAGFVERRVIRPQADDNETIARGATADGFLPPGLARLYGRLLGEGAVVVSVKAPFGEGGAAEAIVRRAEGYEAPPAAPPPRNPAPFSTAFGLPVLTGSRSHTELISKWSFSDFLGIRMLSRRPAPLSQATGMPTLTSRPAERKTTSFGMPMLSGSAAPLSSAVGLPTLTAPKRAWTRSFGMPLLSRKAAPLSSFLGLPVLTRKQ
ncbi:hypothetical protein [Salinarimonas rosea]|uniref:hypothetical protein n=1 Tax=Salinarimonas rosea TaxID=552063 RepID=UPI0003F88055|nr:hypothetical protein [Salinarimonas rosea]